MKKAILLSVVLALGLVTATAQATLISTFETSHSTKNWHDSFPKEFAIASIIEKSFSYFEMTHAINGRPGPKKIHAIDFALINTFTTTKYESGLLISNGPWSGREHRLRGLEKISDISSTPNNTSAPVPEPGTILLFATGIVFIFGSRLIRK